MKKSLVLPIIEEETILSERFDSSDYTGQMIQESKPISLTQKFFGEGRVYHISSDGIIEERYWKLNGAFHGPYLSVFSNNRPFVKCNYSNGKLDGLYQEFNKYGELIKECNYSNGKLNGVYREYHAACGLVSIECNYCQDQLHGQYSKFDDNYNKKYYQCNYIYGKKVFNPLRALANLINGLIVNDPVI